MYLHTSLYAIGDADVIGYGVSLAISAVTTSDAQKTARDKVTDPLQILVPSGGETSYLDLVHLIVSLTIPGASRRHGADGYTLLLPSGCAQHHYAVERREPVRLTGLACSVREDWTWTWTSQGLGLPSASAYVLFRTFDAGSERDNGDRFRSIHVWARAFLLSGSKEGQGR